VSAIVKSPRFNRTVAAFVIAPLWVPAIVLPFAYFFMFPHQASYYWLIVSGILCFSVTYLSAGLIGRPVFRYLLLRNWTAVWVAGLAGFVIAAATWLVFTVLLTLVL